jgi:MscS family membrane protein
VELLENHCQLGFDPDNASSMNLKFRIFHPAYFVFFGLLLFWSVWAGAQTEPVADVTLGTDTTVTVHVQKKPEVYLTFGLEGIPFFDKTLWGIPRWQYISSFIYIFLAFYFSKLVDFLIRARLARKLEKSRARVDDRLLGLIRGPIKVVTFVILFHVGLQVLDWPEYIAKLLSQALQVVVAISLTYTALKFVDLVLSYWKERETVRDDKTFHDQLFPIVNKTLKAFIIGIAVLVTSQNLGFHITGLIASLSIGGLALGLAAQDTLANLFGAVSIFVDKPFRVGERIQLDAVDGTVESIGLRSTRVRNLDGHLITIPNKTMAGATITNITLRPNIRTLINIGITYGTSLEKVKEALQILEDVYRNHPMTHDVWISFNKFADFSLNIFIVHWWNSTVFKDYLAGMQEMNLTIKERFDAAGIDFAFPTSTVHLKQDSDLILKHFNSGNSQHSPSLPPGTEPARING